MNHEFCWLHGLKPRDHKGPQKVTQNTIGSLKAPSPRQIPMHDFSWYLLMCCSNNRHPVLAKRYYVNSMEFAAKKIIRTFRGEWSSFPSWGLLNAEIERNRIDWLTSPLGRFSSCFVCPTFWCLVPFKLGCEKLLRFLGVSSPESKPEESESESEALIASWLCLAKAEPWSSLPVQTSKSLLEKLARSELMLELSSKVWDQQDHNTSLESGMRYKDGGIQAS